MQPTMLPDDTKGAVFSRDRTWRYTLWRDLTPEAYPTMNVIGLNPSTATEHVDDPTIRRCIGFAKLMHCGRLVMTNIFAYRATNPQEMMEMHRFAQGMRNDEHILKEAQKAQIVVAAWGVHGVFRNRGQEVLNMLVTNGVIVHCFGMTKEGYPKHPLFLPKRTPLEVWQYEHSGVSEVRVGADAPNTPER